MRPLPAWLLTARPFLPTSSSFSGSHHLGSFAVDFDDTITSQDTTSAVLFETVAVVAANNAKLPSSAARRGLWAELTTWYLNEATAWRAKDYQEHVSEDLTSQPPSVRRAALLQHAQRLSAFEAQCVRRVSDSGVMAGATRTQLREGARTRGCSLVRPGVVEALNLARELGAPPHVVSINWSKDVVTEVLACSGCGEASDFAAVVCNDLIYESASSSPLNYNPVVSDHSPPAPAAVAVFDASEAAEPLSTGEVDDRSVSGAWGKVFVQRGIVASTSTPQPDNGISIFVGDSLTDLAALVESDVGVIMVKSSDVPLSSSLQQACSAFGVEIVPLRDYLTIVEPSPPAENADSASGATEADEKPLRIYSTDSWFEVAEMLSALK